MARDAEAEQAQRGPGNSARPCWTTRFGGDGVGRQTLRRRIKWAELKRDLEEGRGLKGPLTWRRKQAPMRRGRVAQP